ncbi:hypothetical protein [Paracoccus salsus]|uniref:hypothetical protein n=1 Tax=Paracoccus salsus TaxID=2911061 RepID=UPI001F163412|nr:hypothetical protein [Paracoccus salsus]MCF3972552.1 hypothetical protein [Paracoccus salsus]
MNRSARSGEADRRAKRIDAAAVTMNMPAGSRRPGEDEKTNAPEIIRAEMMKPLSEIMMVSLVAASAMVSRSAW